MSESEPASDSEISWPPFDIVIAALGLLLLNTWAFAAPFLDDRFDAGPALIKGATRLVAWAGWLTTTLLTLLALCPTSKEKD